VGFAVVEIPETKQKVISWFILWPVGQPTWITVVGAKACGTQPLFDSIAVRSYITRRSMEEAG
jgi:hypothetical protein